MAAVWAIGGDDLPCQVLRQITKRETGGKSAYREVEVYKAAHGVSGYILRESRTKILLQVHQQRNRSIRGQRRLLPIELGRPQPRKDQHDEERRGQCHIECENENGVRQAI